MTTPATAPELVLVGNLLVDDLVFEDGSTRMGQAGGALLHAALAAAAWGSRVGCVSVVGTDYPEVALATLRARGVALEGLSALGTPGARVWLLYEEQGRHMVPRQGRPTHEQVSPWPELVPLGWQDAPAMHLAPMPLGRQGALAARFAGRVGLLSLDPCEPVTPASLGAWREVLAHTDVFFASDEELRLKGVSEAEAVRALAGGRLRYVLHKRGARGGTLYDAHEGTTHTWTACPAREVDPTGAGDAFAGAFMAALAGGAHVADALARGAATASLAVEGIGSTRLASVTRSELDARVRA